MEKKISARSIDFVEKILHLALKDNISDVHLKAGGIVHLRVDGKLKALGTMMISEEQIMDFIKTVLPESCRERWSKETQADFNYTMRSGQARFRVNCFMQRGQPSAIFRYIKKAPTSFENILIEGKTFRKLCSNDTGMILVCGPTGGGKSTTLATMVNYINQTSEKHVVTLEDPIEFYYEDLKSVVSQREVGQDIDSFANGLSGALRQDPDVIMIGEMRDADTFSTALRAAETGHLVLSSMHATDTKQAVQRLLDFFPSTETESRARQIANSLIAIITQRLLVKYDGLGMVPVMEIFIIKGVAESMLAKGRLELIPDIIEGDETLGSISFNRDLYRLYKSGLITEDEAKTSSSNPGALDLMFKGIQLRRGSIIQ